MGLHLLTCKGRKQNHFEKKPHIYLNKYFCSYFIAKYKEYVALAYKFVSSLYKFYIFFI